MPNLIRMKTCDDDVRASQPAKAVAIGSGTPL
jgi:hypothetical protein